MPGVQVVSRDLCAARRTTRNHTLSGAQLVQKRSGQTPEGLFWSGGRATAVASGAPRLRALLRSRHTRFAS